MKALLGRVFLVVIFFLLSLYNTLKKWSILPFPLACRVSVDKSAYSLMEVPLHITCCFALAAFSILSLFLTSAILITVCLDLVLFWLILFGTLCTSWNWMSISSPRPGKLSTIMSSNMSWPLSLSFFSWDPYNVNVLMLFQRSLKLSSFFVFILLFILLHGRNFHHSVFQLTSLFFCIIYSAVDSFWSIFHFILLYCSF